MASTETPSWFNESDLDRLVRQSDAKVTLLDIVRLVGRDGAWNLIGEYGGCQVYIPKMNRIHVPIRNELMRAEFDKGATYRELARKHSVSMLHVRRIVA